MKVYSGNVVFYCFSVPSDRGQQGGSREARVQPISDEGQAPHGTKCQPKCTPDYCTANPKAICSAV